MNSLSLAETERPESELVGTQRYVPVLMDGVHVLPFDSSLVEKRYLLVRRDGRRWGGRCSVGTLSAC